MSDSVARPDLPRIRSALFVPTSNSRYLDGIDRRHADAVILDLEDGITDESRDTARHHVSEWLAGRELGSGPAIFARINRLDAGHLDADLGALVRPALRGIVLPKVTSTDDVRQLSDALGWYEGRHGLPLGSIVVWPLIESAIAVNDAYEIGRCDRRVAYMGGATAPGGDLARALGIEVSKDGLETLVLRSQVLIAARAAGTFNPVTGMYTELDDLEGFERFAQQSRAIGYDGIMVIHPSHVPIANQLFTPGAAAVADARAVIEALEQARQAGAGAIRHEGRMVDKANADTAQRLIDEHEALLTRGLPAEPTPDA
jgi:citrate lyase subunit beta/citryl-CoA lyase